jgi:hypothetical protein
LKAATVYSAIPAFCLWRQRCMSAFRRRRKSSEDFCFPTGVYLRAPRRQQPKSFLIVRSVAYFAKLIAEEIEKWGKVIRAANIKAE